MKNLSFIIKSLLLIFSVVFLLSCNSSPDIQLIKDNRNSTKTYFFDYSTSFINGFVIPSISNDGIHSFHLTFQLNNFKDDTLYYKLFYQNESYKFSDEKDGDFSSENFYGCSEATLENFIKLSSSSNHSFTINDSLQIVGNPRNEERYFGKNAHIDTAADTTGLRNTMNRIQNDKKWYESIIEKAKSNSINTQKQLELDAIWLLSNNNSNISNNRWQRNPRVGNYSVLLVVTTKEGLKKIPEFIQNTTQSTDTGLVNPYSYFLGNEEAISKEIFLTYLIDTFITTKAIVPIKNGIYIPYSNYTDKEYFNTYVNDSKRLYEDAAFEIQSTSLHQKTILNIPLRTAFISANYTKEEYKNNIEKYDANRIETRFVNTTSPGKTFGIDSINNFLWFKNPFYKDEFRKENVGIKTRHGLTYGKYTFKIKMANLLTKDNVWTGLTNAMWLVKESDEPWNYRRICEKEGFMPRYGAEKGEVRVPQIGYSEIDFEILKTAETWPWTSYEDKKERTDPASNDDKVMVTCTNWDMACKQPINFGIGIQKTTYNNQEFFPHRWNEYYNALTTKTPAKDVDLFSGEYYYFQIEWTPREIIWRIGPSKDQLKVVCYMNDEITTIPNNQMVAVITQEYHFSDWWPKSPYQQENIPFPGEDLKGKLYSIEIE